MKTLKVMLLLLISITFYNCSSDSENDLIETSDDDQTNTNFQFNYEDDIRPIMTNSCVSCHANPPVNGAPFSLVDFNRVSQRADAILSAMEKQNGASNAMPPSGRLPQSTIDIVEQWIADGKPRN